MEDSLKESPNRQITVKNSAEDSKPKTNDYFSMLDIKAGYHSIRVEKHQSTKRNSPPSQSQTSNTKQ